VKGVRTICPLLLFALLTGGCTTAFAGDPKPATSGSMTTGAPDTSESVDDRPREIRLDDVDPCKLIPEADYSDYYMDEPGTPKENETFKSPSCRWAGTEVGIFDITVVVTEGIEVWLGGDRVNVNAKRIDPIEDFPSVEVEPKDDENSCHIAVDVADGQYLLASLSIDNLSLSKVPEPCDYARQFAESAMSTLVNQ
jgi:uncharacterized protein DUF3558